MVDAPQHRRTVRSSLPPALTLVLAALGLAACGGNVDFTIARTLDVDTSVDAGQVSGSFDFAAEAGSAWRERGHLDSVSIRGATVTVAAVGPDNAAIAESGTVWLLPEGVTDPADPRAVQVGAWSDEPVVAGHVVALTPSAQLDEFVTSALKGSGKINVVASADGGGARLQVTLHVVIDLRLRWKAV